MTTFIRVPFLRFFFNWVLLLGGIYVLLNGISLEYERFDISWVSMLDEESLLVRVHYGNQNRTETFITNSRDYADHFSLGENISHESFALYASKIAYIQNNDLHIVDSHTREITTYDLPDSLASSIIDYIAWSGYTDAVYLNTTSGIYEIRFDTPSTITDVTDVSDIHRTGFTNSVQYRRYAVSGLEPELFVNQGQGFNIILGAVAILLTVIFTYRGNPQEKYYSLRPLDKITSEPGIKEPV